MIDPFKTSSSGKVEIGAFRTYPNGFVPSSAEESEFQSVPIEKIEEFGVHSKKYYSLDVSYFKSSLDQALIEMLLQKYWLNNLSAPSFPDSNLHFMTKQITDLAGKLDNVNSKIKKDPGYLKKLKCEGSLLEKCKSESHNLVTEAMKGLLSMNIKEAAFGEESEGIQ